MCLGTGSACIRDHQLHGIGSRSGEGMYRVLLGGSATIPEVPCPTIDLPGRLVCELNGQGNLALDRGHAELRDRRRRRRVKHRIDRNRIRDDDVFFHVFCRFRPWRLVDQFVQLGHNQLCDDLGRPQRVDGAALDGFHLRYAVDRVGLCDLDARPAFYLKVKPVAIREIVAVCERSVERVWGHIQMQSRPRDRAVLLDVIGRWIIREDVHISGSADKPGVKSSLCEPQICGLFRKHRHLPARSK